mgnify:CR=1 FL=1
MAKKGDKRSKILIQPYQQLRFGITFLILNFIFTCLLFGTFTYFMWDMYEAILGVFELTNNEGVLSLQKVIKPVLVSLFFCLLFIFMTLYYSARYTHQIYGPLLSIKRFLDEIINGEKPTHIRLRKNDQLQTLVKRLNLIADKFVYPSNVESVQAILNCLDALKEGKVAKKISLSKNDALYEVSLKVNDLIDSK